MAGNIDQAGGLAFGIRNVGNYFVLRVNALEDNLILFQFKDGERHELASMQVPVPSGAWREIAVEVAGAQVTCLLDGRSMLVHHAPAQVGGYIGLWAKADSVTDFCDLALTRPGQVRSVFI